MSVALEAQFDAHAPAVLAFVGLFVTDGARREQVAARALIETLAEHSGQLHKQTRARAVLAALASLNDDFALTGQTPSQSTAALGLVRYGLRSPPEVASDLGCDYHRALALLRLALRERATA